MSSVAITSEYVRELCDKHNFVLEEGWEYPNSERRGCLFALFAREVNIPLIRDWSGQNQISYRNAIADAMGMDRGYALNLECGFDGGNGLEKPDMTSEAFLLGQALREEFAPED